MTAIDQRMGALERANRVRVARAGLKREITSGEQDATGVLLSPPQWAHTMRVWELLRAVPRVGERTATIMLADVGVRMDARVGRLTPRQRAGLAAALRSPSWARVPAPRPSRVRARRSGLVCSRCGEALQRPSEVGLCGFCERGM